MKYDLKQEVFYLKFGKIQHGIVIARTTVEYDSDRLSLLIDNVYSHDSLQKSFGMATTEYAVFNKEYEAWYKMNEYDLFTSKQELIDFISN